MRRLLVIAGVAVALSMGWVTAAPAEVIAEGVSALRCSEGSAVVFPKKMKFTQTIRTNDFVSLGMIGLLVSVDYGDRDSLDTGKVLTTATRVEPDSTRTLLGTVNVRIKQGSAEKVKIYDKIVEKGDLIEWKARLVGMANVDPPSDCWELDLAVAVADDPP